MPAVTLEQFTSPEYKLTGDLTEVPHLGEATIWKLRDHNIRSTHHLIGHYLSGARDKASFIALLEEVGTPKQHRERLAQAIETRVAKCGGVKISVSVPSTIDGKVVSSKLEDENAAAIRRTKFNNDIRHDLPGVGLGRVDDKEKNKSLRSLESHGITCTDHLFGELLKHLDSTPTEENLAAFWKRLGELGVSSGYKTTLICAMKEKLDIGLDNCARPCMATWPEEEPQSPRTDPQTSRTRPLSQGAMAAKSRRQKPSPLPSPDDEQGGWTSRPSIIFPTLCVPFVALLGYHLFAGYSGNQLAIVDPGEWV
jgi:hypothetical protein